MKRPPWIGLLILVVGVLFLLSQLHVFVFHGSLLRPDVLWPLVLAVVGLSGMGGNRRKVPLWPLFLFVLGLILAARNSGFISILQQTTGWNLFWGLFIVFVGLQMLLPARLRRRNFVNIRWERKHRKERHTSARQPDFDPENRSDDMGVVNRKWVGDLSIGQHPWVLKDMTLWNGIGDVRLNLGTARIEPGTYHLAVSGWIGDVRILVPEGLAIQVSSNLGLGDITVFGDNESGMRPAVQYADADFDGAETRVFVSIDLKIGDVQVVRV